MESSADWPNICMTCCWLYSWSRLTGCPSWKQDLRWVGKRRKTFMAYLVAVEYPAELSPQTTWDPPQWLQATVPCASTWALSPSRLCTLPLGFYCDCCFNLNCCYSSSSKKGPKRSLILKRSISFSSLVFTIICHVWASPIILACALSLQTAPQTDP